MKLIHPFWLLLLLPWGVVVWQLLRRRERPARAVPFLPLWAEMKINSATQSLRSPLPWIVWLLLMSLLCAITAAAEPVWRTSASAVTIIVDCGFRMSLDNQRRTLVNEVDRRLHAGRVRLMTVPGSIADLTGRDWVAAALRAAPTVVPTDDLIAQAVRAALWHDGNPIIVISDKPIPANPRVLSISPRVEPTNVGIAEFVVTDGPVPQAMVRIFNASAATMGTLIFKSLQLPIRLPPRGSTRDYFVNLTSPLPDTIPVRLVASHTSPLNDTARVVRASATPLRWAVLGTVPPPVIRLVDIYDRLRPSPAGAKSAVIQIDNGDHHGQSIWLAVERGSAARASASPTVTPDPLTADVTDWPAPADPHAVPPAGWRVLVRSGNTAMLAERANRRGIWLNANLQLWAQHPSFVIFFANAMDAIAGTSRQWTSSPPHALGAGWRADAAVPSEVKAGEWPGVYRKEGRGVAINAPSLSSALMRPTRKRTGGGAARLRPLTVLARLPLVSSNDSAVAWIIAIAAAMVAVGVFLGFTRR